MLFHLYGETAGYQLLGWLLVFVGLIVTNEIARRKWGGIAIFGVVLLGLTVYFIAIAIGAGNGAEWALNNDTYIHMNSWFHYAKLYAAATGCIGFMVIKYKWGKLGKAKWFKAFPFVIVAINILIAVASDFESAVRGFNAAGNLSGGWWYSSEGVWVYGGWWNILNGLAGLINIFCMTAWWSVYTSEDQLDMLWPDMTWVYILAYDVWNFEYTYLNLPTHAWYCGLALLLAPTFANFLWNKGGWIQNRANTLAIWCMFAQVFPMFQDGSIFSTVPVVYASGSIYDATAAGVTPTLGTASMQGFIAVLALAINVVALGYIIKKSKATGKNPYKYDVFTEQSDWKEATARIETSK